MREPMWAMRTFSPIVQSIRTQLYRPHGTSTPSTFATPSAGSELLQKIIPRMITNGTRINSWYSSFNRSSEYRELRILAFNILEVFHCADFQLVRRGLVAYDDAMTVQLQHRNGPHVIHAFFDHFLERPCLAVTDHQNDQLLRVHDRPDANCQRRLRDLIRVVAKEPGIRDPCVVGQRLDPGAGRKGRSRLVERDVSVGTDTAKKQVDTPYFLDLLFVVLALLLQVFCVTVQDVDVLVWNVDMAEKMMPHEIVIALRMVLRQSHILVHVERDDVFERDFPLLVKTDQVLVRADGRRTRRQSEDIRPVLRRFKRIDLRGKIVSRPFAQRFVCVVDDDAHGEGSP